MNSNTATRNQINLGTGYGWTNRPLTYETVVHFKGYLQEPNRNDSVASMTAALRAARQGSLDKLSEVDGHFACVLEDDGCVVVAVDRVRSIPMLLAPLPNGGWVIADHAEPIMQALRLSTTDIASDAARDFALAGYVIGTGALYRNVRALLPGEVAVIEGDAAPRIHRYALYRPWLAVEATREESNCRHRLRELTLAILQKMIDSVQGRQFLLPLSAGLDSRLIASGLKHLGYRNVVCFSYGRPGNHEADAARQIAERLGYPWHFIPTVTREVRRKRQGEDFARYLRLADNLVATPVEQDVFTIMDLHLMPWADRDGVIVNGQSGDYLSGNHIPSTLLKSMPASREERDQLIFEEMVAKHFDLWSDLKTPEELARLKKRVWEDLEQAAVPLDDPRLAYALYEFSEYQNRQAKYVLGNQRSYEVFGWEWRLPLWDKDYLDFWQHVPLSQKFGQRLYREMLVDANWGGVWKELLPAPRWVTPSWIRPVRHAAHLMCLPFGETRWKAVDRRFFNHLTDPLRKYAAVPYFRVATGPAHRNVVAWLTASYLTRHRLSRDGSPQ